MSNAISVIAFVVPIGCSSQEQEKQSSTARRIVCLGVSFRVDLSLTCYAVDAVGGLAVREQLLE